MPVTVVRSATSGDRSILYYSDGRMQLAYLGRGRDEPTFYPAPEEHEVELDDDYLDQWSRAETDYDVPPEEPFNEIDEQNWELHMEEEEG